MRIFIFSRRFLAVLFVILLLHLGYFAWEFWDLYGDDFTGKGISRSFAAGFIWNTICGDPLLYSFLAAFLLATAFCFHQLKKKGNYDHPFSTRNLIVVVLVAILGFFYISFVVPKTVTRSRQLISAVVYARPGEEPVIVDLSQDKDVKMMTIPELFKERKAIALRKKDKNSAEYLYPVPGSIFKWVDWEIGRKLVYPLYILMFYIMGVLLGLSLHRTYGFLVLLFAYFLVFHTSFICKSLLERLYRHDNAGLVPGIFGPVILQVIISIPWYFLLKKQGAFRDQEKMVVDSLFAGENNGQDV